MKIYISSSEEPKYMNEPRLYEVHEVFKKKEEVYPVMMTGKELKDFMQSKREMNGYVEGLGGDKSYACWAVEMQG